MGLMTIGELFLQEILAQRCECIHQSQRSSQWSDGVRHVWRYGNDVTRAESVRLTIDVEIHLASSYICDLLMGM